MSELRPTLLSLQAKWATRFATYDLGLLDGELAKLRNLILRKETEYDESLPGKPQTGLFPPFSSLYKKQELLTWADPEVAKLRDAIGLVSRMYIDEVLGAETAIIKVDAWANIHRPGNWHGPHSHYAGGTETASGVIWLEVPPKNEGVDWNGTFVFADPRGPYHPGRYREVIEPQPGVALLFPSWQQHFVAPLAPNSLRISVGFDVLCDKVIP